jgi:hypothetical protein
MASMRDFSFEGYHALLNSCFAPSECNFDFLLFVLNIGSEWLRRFIGTFINDQPNSDSNNFRSLSVVCTGRFICAGPYRCWHEFRCIVDRHVERRGFDICRELPNPDQRYRADELAGHRGHGDSSGR